MFYGQKRLFTNNPMRIKNQIQYNHNRSRKSKVQLKIYNYINV